MQTLRLTTAPDDIARAAEILRSGGLVAFPTETVYGLGANALDPAAVARIFAAKDRPAWDPVIVHIAGLVSKPASNSASNPVQDNPMLGEVAAEVSEIARQLIEAFWPGPLTLLLPRSARIPDAVTAGRPLVGVRMPAHPTAFELIRLAGVPVAAPSANRFGHTSPTTAEHVLADLDGRIDAVIDAGPARHGVESTVLDPAQNPPVIYRPGAVTLEQIRAVVGAAVLYEPDPKSKSPAEANSADSPAGLPSPGVGIRHYAPRARLILVEMPDSAPEPDLAAALARAAAGLASKQANARLGILLPREFAQAAPPEAVVFDWGSWNAPEELAARLYAGLRALDAAGCEVILCPLPVTEGIGQALRDRLRKAAWEE
jgi:L-threonylcarbamoyladenylate synthase